MTDKIVAIGIVTIIAIAITPLALQPYFKSRAYNRLTGAHTTYWDALWLDLRVQSEPK